MDNSNAVMLSTEQVNLISRTIAKGASKDELAMFIGQCKRTQLDPFTRQIYFIKDSSGRIMTQISIDGFRVIAQRSGDYAGQDAPVFDYDNNGRIKKCSVTVYRWRNDTRYQAAVGVAFFEEYYKKSQTWDKMPHTMISKVAECIALRRSFPNDLSGLYSEEEMDQAVAEGVIDAPMKESKTAKKAEMAELMETKTVMAKVTGGVVSSEGFETTQDEPIYLCPICKVSFMDGNLPMGNVKAIENIGMCNACSTK